jgi:hypothetical protein
VVWAAAHGAVLNLRNYKRFMRVMGVPGKIRLNPAFLRANTLGVFGIAKHPRSMIPSK